MDMQKEKIAHEKHLLSQGVDFKYLPNIQYNELENVYELIEWGEEYSEALNEINSSWCTWQAAKAQAVPECTWVQNEDGYFDASCGQSFVFPDPDDTPSSHKFTHCCFCGGQLIEAQEPTND